MTHAKPSNKIPVSVRFTPDIIERLDRLAHKAGLDRTSLMTNLIETGVVALENSEKVGLLQIGILIRDLEYTLKDWATGWKKKQIQI